ncbi:response regulator [Arenibaculum pallidiluteum]|uniref:response regulator n=1 Tax=Arenibaculum pallidiluteum TaxID=2812559 RepID=UPI002E2C0CDF|nr:response regulator [Arenibaculum pallidiluteum]
MSEPTLLVVDDSKLARMLVHGILSRVRPGWRMVEAVNAEQALDAMDEHSIQIALIDFNMPGMNGLDLAASIRSHRRDIPLAILSANAQDEIIQRTRALDAAFLEKPVKEQALSAFLAGAALPLRFAE